MTLAWHRLCGGVALGLVLASPALAQDLDPRAYVHVPVNATFLIVGLGISDGAVVTDPIAASTGAIVRLGTDFTSFSVAWQTAWAPRPTMAGETTSENGP